MGTVLSHHFGLPRDQIRSRISPEQLREAQMAVVPFIIEQPTIFNTHLMVRHQNLYMFNPDFVKAIRPVHYVAIVGHPEDILQWRIAAEQKARVEDGVRRVTDLEDVARIDMHQSLLVNSLSLWTEKEGNGLTIVYNNPQDTDENIAQLREIINTNFS